MESDNNSVNDSVSAGSFSVGSAISGDTFNLEETEIDPAEEKTALAEELALEFMQIEPGKLPDSSVAFEKLYEDFPCETARVLSRRERETLEYVESSLTYGEITFEPFKHIFERLYALGLPNTGGTFVDVGCGSGRPV